MNVLCCQLDIVWEDKTANHLKVEALLEQSAPPEDTLVILPEMFATGFSMNVNAITDSSSRETESFLSQTAARHKVFVLGGTVNSDAAGRGRNECVVFSPQGTEVARYCKLHPFTFGGEAQHYAAGSGVQIFRVGEFTGATFICYDLRFPEIFRAAVRRGANLFTVIANWPSTRIDHWTTLLKARAIENQAYVVGVNRCGDDPHLSYPGRSVIFDPRGRVVVEADAREGAMGADLDLQALTDYRRELPFLKDMRQDYVPEER
ncbi:MAG TPA: carbon-nitrogen family hydrolase [Pyrinomonadaceae bacterium]|nr:carbon-nitrogen family hydrolase [Pyrinomonadaceae bacterium]